MSYLVSSFGSAPLSAFNGDSSSEDDVFLNAKLDLFGGNRYGIRDKPKYYAAAVVSGSDGEGTRQMVLSPGSPRSDQTAIIFTISFCGKVFGEVGLFEPDISILDWEGFKSYLFSSLNLESPESFVISYSDDETEKIPIDSEAEYREALKIAKEKANRHEKFGLAISRSNFGFPESLRSLVSSSIRRVNSVGKPKKDATTSTSFINLKGSIETPPSTSECSEMSEDSEAMLDIPALPNPQPIQPLNFIVDINTKDSTIRRIIPTREKIWSQLGIKTYKVGYHEYNCRREKVFASRPVQFLGQPAMLGKMITSERANTPLTNNGGKENEISFYCTFNCHLNHLGQDGGPVTGVEANPPEKVTQEGKTKGIANDNDEGAPLWFTSYMQQLKEDISQEISSKINEKFEDLIGNFSTFDGEERLRKVIEGYGAHLQERVICCCKAEANECKRGGTYEGGSSGKEASKGMKREVLSCIDETIEKIKLQSQGSNYLDIEGWDRVLTRIEGMRNRQSRTAVEIDRLHAIASVSNTANSLATSTASTASENLVQRSSTPEYDAKFVKDENYPDGSILEPGEIFNKSWLVLNSGKKQWDDDCHLQCIGYYVIENFLPPLDTNPIPCPHLMPGQQGVVTVSLETPRNRGTYFTQMKFTRDSKQFGDLLWCSIQVSHPSPHRELMYFSSDTLNPPPEYRCYEKDLVQLKELGPTTQSLPGATNDLKDRKQLINQILLALQVTKIVWDLHKYRKLIEEYLWSGEKETFDMIKNHLHHEYEENDYPPTGQPEQELERLLKKFPLPVSTSSVFLPQETDTTEGVAEYPVEPQLFGVNSSLTDTEDLEIPKEGKQKEESTSGNDDDYSFGGSSNAEPKMEPTNQDTPNSWGQLNDDEASYFSYTHSPNSCFKTVTPSNEAMEPNNEGNLPEEVAEEEHFEEVDSGNEDEWSDLQGHDLGKESLNVSDPEDQQLLSVKFAEGESLAVELAEALKSLSSESSESEANPELKKNEMSHLKEQFKQNLEVSAYSCGSVETGPEDPLTFMERHFTLTTLPPSDPPPVADDDSDDGLVFIKFDEVVSSAPETASPSEHDPRPGSCPHQESELSFSCSSVSDFRDADGEDNESLSCSSFSGVEDNIPPEDSVSEVSSTTNQDTVTTSEVVTERSVQDSSSICFQSALGTDNPALFRTINSPDQTSQSRRSATPTLQDALPSLSSDSPEPTSASPADPWKKR